MAGLFDIDESTGEVREAQIWEVSTLTARIKQTLSADPLLNWLTVRGEITNLSRSSAGHIYFGLKDDKAYLKCVAFRGAAQKLADQPKEGEIALASGRIGLYEAGGSYQLYVEDLILAGKGELFLAFEALKKKLQAEGLFDEARKKPLPVFPRIVGVVTSPSGAVVRDIIRVSGELSPHVKLIISPALVQGETAATSIIKAIDRLEKLDNLDLIIIARGGGSFEDLNCFNDEALARRIARCILPTVSAVGHETDFTIADFVADLRAPTPTAAAQMTLPKRDTLIEQVDGLLTSAASEIIRDVTIKRRELLTYAARLNIFKPFDRINQFNQKVDELGFRAVRAFRGRLKTMRAMLNGVVMRASSLDPQSVLKRGYALVYNTGGALVSDASMVTRGDTVTVKLKTGIIDAEVKDTRDDPQG